MTDSLTETLASLQSAAQAIRRVTIETERRAHARGNSAFAGGGEEEQEQEQDEDEDEEGCVLLGIQRRITRGLILRCASRTSFWSWKVRIDVFGAFQRTSETNVEKLSG
ncbi:predicted protein [Botrytis cinerea T4]|uniref:Uncharacterized protein n=1 Tax=Botryotinia fuckeliana (strain T4) TaxID=999810 RepID=G2XR81_BOTF4|nr:predicted protein [Botrytis cinerea T4]